MVLIREIASAPAPSTALATAQISVTWGVSLTISGRRVARRISETTWAALGWGPKGVPPPGHIGTGDVDFQGGNPRLVIQALSQLLILPNRVTQDIDDYRDV